MTLIHEYFNLIYFNLAKNMAENLKPDVIVLRTSHVKIKYSLLCEQLWLGLVKPFSYSYMEQQEGKICLKNMYA